MDEISKLEQIRLRLVMEGESRNTDSKNTRELISKNGKEIIGLLKSILLLTRIICGFVVFYVINSYIG